MSDPIFCSRARGGTNSRTTIITPLSSQGVMEIVKRVCSRAGISHPSLLNLHPHDLRRSFAQMCKEGGADMDMIKHSMGHSSITTTERYLRDIQNLQLGHTAPDHIKVKRGTK